MGAPELDGEDQRRNGEKDRRSVGKISASCEHRLGILSRPASECRKKVAGNETNHRKNADHDGRILNLISLMNYCPKKETGQPPKLEARENEGA
jgi:hypothetical protein